MRPKPKILRPRDQKADRTNVRVTERSIYRKTKGPKVQMSKRRRRKTRRKPKRDHDRMTEGQRERKRSENQNY